MPILLLLLCLLATAASTRQDNSVILVTGGWADATYDYDNDTGLVLSSTEVLGDSCPVASLPLPLYGHTTFLTADGLLLTCGGISGGFNSDNLDCFAWETSSQSWIRHSTLPTSYILVAASVSMPAGVYLFNGGEVTSLFLPTGSTVWLDGPLKNSDGICAVAISASKFLVIGGLGLGDDPNRVEEFDTVTSTWTSWPPLNQGRSDHSCMRAGNNVVIAGGWDQEGQLLASTTILSIEDKIQRPGGDMSLARSAFQMVNHGDKLLAIGGDRGLDSGYYGGPGLNLVEEWNEATEDWTAREDLRMDTNRQIFGAVDAPRSAVCGTI